MGIHGVYKTEECLFDAQYSQACLEPNETITWNGLTINTSGLYRSLYTNINGCQGYSYFNVGETITNGQITRCYLQGQAINIGGISVEAPGTYTFEAGCAQDGELTITPLDTVRVDTMIQTGAILFGVTVRYDGQKVARVRDVNDCISIYIYTVSLVSSTTQLLDASVPSVYPTLLGSDRTFRIRTSGQAVKRVEVITLSRKQVKLTKMGTAAWQLQTSASGVYIVRIHTQTGVYVNKIVLR